MIPFFAAATLAAVSCTGTCAMSHVATADYWGGYSGTHTVSASDAAPWLTWASTDIAGSQALRPLGVKTMLYTDPNRQIAGEPLYTSDESTFAHDCVGGKIATARQGQYLMDPRSPSLSTVWRTHVARYTAEGHFDAIFEDDAGVLVGARGLPCMYNEAQWLSATIAMQRALGYPVIYNGLSDRSGDAVSKTIALNATAIGGMMEQCYATSAKVPAAGDADWVAAEQTQRRMAAEGKLFFCLALDPTQASDAIAGRTYLYASFLIGYDPQTSVIWTIYRTPSKQHVMPEVQLVPGANGPPPALTALRLPSGAYERAFAACSLAGKPAGPCAAIVNPTGDTVRFSIAGYARSLALSGSGALDGGRAFVASGAAPTLAPRSAEILFK